MKNDTKWGRSWYSFGSWFGCGECKVMRYLREAGNMFVCGLGPNVSEILGFLRLLRKCALEKRFDM